MEVNVIKIIFESDQLSYNQLIKITKDRKQLNTTDMHQADQNIENIVEISSELMIHFFQQIDHKQYKGSEGKADAVLRGTLFATHAVTYLPKVNCNRLLRSMEQRYN